MPHLVQIKSIIACRDRGVKTQQAAALLIVETSEVPLLSDGAGSTTAQWNGDR